WGGILKPDVVAPGVSVRSSYNSSDTAYASLSGTSMATPHVAGVATLLLAAKPTLTYTDVFAILTRTTYFQPSWGTQPNNNYGWGLVQADAAVDMGLHGPVITGTVSSGGYGLPNATVNFVRSSDNDMYNVLTAGTGNY